VLTDKLAKRLHSLDSICGYRSSQAENQLARTTQKTAPHTFSGPCFVTTTIGLDWIEGRYTGAWWTGYSNKV
jgi:hypothetical protein